MLLDELVFDESPCELCPLIARCSQGQACAAFESFIRYGGRRWRTEAREPSVELYARIFRKPGAAKGIRTRDAGDIVGMA
jgi:hypothetical protein